MKKNGMSIQTRRNWLVDACLFTSALIAVISGIYFLYFPIGGYQGGRNPMYGIVVLFERHTWEDLHVWGGIAMIIISAVHLLLHWSWIVNMIRRTVKELTGRCVCMNARGRWNLILNTSVALSFMLTALSGMYFFFFPGGRGISGPIILFNRSIWDIIHTWSGVVLTLSAVLHFAIHWRWVKKVTMNMLPGIPTMPAQKQVNNQTV